MRRVIAMALGGLLIRGAVGAADVPCADGTRLVLRSPGGKAAPRFIAVRGDQWSLETPNYTCSAGAIPSVRVRRGRTLIKVAWTECGAAVQTVRFVGRVRGACTRVWGTLRSGPPAHRMRMTGHPSRCGDAASDRNGGEECDGNATTCSTAFREVCTAGCRCDDPALPVDPAFGTNGSVALGASGGAFAVDAAGRLLVEVANGDGTFSLRRLLANGARDVAFPDHVDVASRILPLPDGGFLTMAAVIRRWDDAGLRVLQFGTAGELPATRDLRVLADGRFVTFDAADGLRRYLADGTPDPLFTPQPLALPAGTVVEAETFLTGGRMLLVVDRPEPPFTLHSRVAYRLRADGTVDPTYGAGGSSYLGFIMQSPLGPRVDGIVALADDSVIVQEAVPGGLLQQTYISLKLTPAGEDQPFDGSGAGRLAGDPAGRILAAFGTGSAPLATRIGMSRRLGDGSLDETFGHGGVLATPIRGPVVPFPFPAGHIFGLVVLPDGDVLLGAEDTLLRLRPDGS